MATTDRIDNYPGFEEGIDGFELGERMERQAWRFGVSTVYGEVRSVELAGRPKRIESTEGSFEAEAVILATGAFPRELGLPDEQALRGRGVAYCAACDGMLYRGKTVVVNGGGNTAVGDALYLAKLCKKVYLVHRRDELRASAVYRDALRENGVEILWNSRITALRKEKRLTGVEVEDLRTGARRSCSATACLWPSAGCRIRPCLPARWSWTPRAISWRMKPPAPACPASLRWAMPALRRCARSSPQWQTGPWRPTMRRSSCWRML